MIPLALCLQDLEIALDSGWLCGSRLTSLCRAKESFECINERWICV